MKKVYRYTLTIDPDVMKSLRIIAAKKGLSTPKYIREVLEKDVNNGQIRNMETK